MLRRNFACRPAAAQFEPLECRRLLSSDATWTGPTFYVDDDLQQRHDAQFTSIEVACAVAPPFSTIFVYPGVYNEMVHVTKPLRLLGSSHDRRPRNQPPDPQHDSIVQFTSPAGGIFNLLSNTIELDGFVIQNNASDPGVYTSPLFSDYLIERNTIQNNVFGLYLNSNGVMQSVVYDNSFLGNTRPGAASSNGIYSDQGLRNALVEHNYFTGHANASMVFDSFVGTNDGIIARKNFIENDSSIAVFNSSNVLVEQNFVRRPNGTGIFLGGGTANVTIDQNIVDESLDGSGIVVTGAIGAGTNVNAVVTRNLVADSAFSGIRVEESDGAQVKRNVILRNAVDGIRITNASNNTVAGNNSLHNGRDGIRVEAGTASNNRIVSNNLKQNGEHDAHDDTVGPGSGGTANYWIDNSGQTENRPGLIDRGNAGSDADAATADTASYDTALSADPYATGDFVLPTFDVPEDPAVPLLPDLDLLGLQPKPLL
jgi:parallel beta-helix repeat protein